ncbi:23S rRNA (uracil(1939)-C(5))-methyltransferase RlmD [Ohessyouella blattaphilus]|uniref:23S rRNA (Uracil(1939)-C(5))-methyltransferase RlmD n=1 Tax=Ohessyouella blattaphilus TaxID=2949333 RepID=A0ABT1EJ66_9FIRM|nr:23S rRNA (uracil(1939)-C(5))-methyltransferase RlmD [Ohessyouella blattaphilus]MCP1110744.1 23S rRNA (uracil(1939)-C(5))-methyltransferase RlmD [Ohessyouella blattaphilus]MCR8564138.1 23S rRNA (uracil(1939)-C(5))-methyltransferase RlmD [Ohessyouella blattaphilus]
MKKKAIYEGVVERVDFPNKSVVNVSDEEEQALVKGGIPGQKIRFQVTKKRSGRAVGRLLEVVEKSPVEIPPTCVHFGRCGGCAYQNLAYETQLALKEEQVKRLLSPVLTGTEEFLPIKGSPIASEYRNKMEFSFGDEVKNGPLALGMHKKGSFHDIVNVPECQLVDGDFRKILSAILTYFTRENVPFYHKMSHEGYLRHLLVRKGKKTGEILVDLITTSALARKEEDFKEVLLSLDLEGKIVGILHTHNDALGDVVKDEGTTILYGQDYFFEELLGLRFKISPFSFFQTNSLGAEVLYETTREFIGETKDKVIFDLYSGTGTIAQLLAPVATKVVGVEIVEEAVVAATENAKLNNLDNCEFIAGDVLKVIDELKDKPDLIVLDPPRDGIHPKALEKIINFGVNRIVYVSCKPTSLARDLEVLLARGYEVEKVCPIDQFPSTVHVENVTLLTRSEMTKGSI